MSANVKMLAFLVCIAIFTLIASYSVYLNMEFGFCALKSPWISNDLLFSIFSGAFASVVIASLMEIRQYTLNKVVAKNQIFRDVVILFGQLSVIKYTLLRIKEQPNNIITPEAFTMPISLCEQTKESLYNIDYHPIWKCDKLADNLKEIEALVVNRIAPFLFNAKFIQQAILQDKISDLQQTGKSTNPTYNSYYCKLTVDKLLEDVIPIVNDLTACSRKIARATNRQERFNQMYDDFTRYEENFEAPSLEKFLGL